MKEVLSYKIQEIKDFDRDSTLLNGLCLWVIHADKIPPHIGISLDHKFYSLKSNGVDEGISSTSLLKIIDGREICTLIIELKSNVQDVAEGFGRYRSTITGSITCLDPIKEILSIPSAEKIHHLLAELTDRNELSTVYGLHVPDEYSGIPEYELADIHNRLRKLDEKGR